MKLLQSHTPSPPASYAPSMCTPSLTAAAGEQLEVNYQVHELPVELAEDLNPSPQEPEQDIVVNAALLSWIKVLESENMQLKGCLEGKKRNPFTIEQIQHDD